MTGYVHCACHECFEVAIGEPGDALCHACDEAGCDGEGSCQAADCDEEVAS